MANTSAPQLFSGPRGKITFKGQVVALITSISVSEQEGLRATHIVGEYHPVAIDPISYDVSVSIGRIIPVTKNSVAGAAAPSPGRLPIVATPAAAMDQVSAMELGFEPLLNSVLSLDAVEIVIYDKNPTEANKDYTIAKIVGCRFTGRSTSVNSGDVASESFNFTGQINQGYAGDDSSLGGEETLLASNYGFEG